MWLNFVFVSVSRFQRIYGGLALIYIRQLWFIIHEFYFSSLVVKIGLLRRFMDYHASLKTIVNNKLTRVITVETFSWCFVVVEFMCGVFIDIKHNSHEQ